MKIGALRNRVQIDEPVRSRDRTGDEAISDWRQVAKRWADVEGGPAGAEGSVADQQVATQSYVIKMRYCPFVTGHHSILLRGRRLQINSVSHVGPAGQETTITAAETTAPEPPR